MTEPNPLRVVQIVTTLARGGAQATVMASSETEVMAADGVDVSVLAGPDVTAEGSWWDDPAIERIVVDAVPHLVRRPAPVRDLAALWWLVRELRRRRPDVVHTHSAKAGVLGRLAALAAGRPVVHTVHGWGPLHSTRPTVRWVCAAVERTLARRVRALVLVGSADVEMARRWRIGREERFRVIRSGVEVPAESSLAGLRLQARRQLGLDGRFVVGMVGRLAFPKDQRTLIEAFRLAGLADATLVLVGDGPDRPELERFIATETELDIRLVGSRADGAELVAGFDVAVHSSRWEGMPRTVVEAAAVGVPLVVSNVGSVAELVEDGFSGRLVTPGDAEAMASAIGELQRDPVAAKRLGARARDRVEPFSADRMRHELVELWCQVADRSHPATGRATPAADPTPSTSAGVVRSP